MIDYIAAMRVFETPEQFDDAVRPMFRNEEIALINAMGTNLFTNDELRELILKCEIGEDPEELIQSAYHRAIISKKKMRDNLLCWKLANFYTRYPYFAQYEPEKYGPFPSEVKKAMNDWCIEEYIRQYAPVVQGKLAGKNLQMHQSDYMTLEETFAVIDQCENTISIMPCNCKAMMYYQTKPVEVCINISPKRDNSQFDRGYGRVIDKEEAKRLVKEFNRKGLMQCGEADGFCNCDGYACYPVMISKRLGARGIYPRAHYRIDWHEEECINCGRCTQVCNFGAFYFDAYRKVHFDAEKCWGCTICSANCGKKAIHLEKLDV